MVLLSTVWIDKRIRMKNIMEIGEIYDSLLNLREMKWTENFVSFQNGEMNYSQICQRHLVPMP